MKDSYRTNRKGNPTFCTNTSNNFSEFENIFGGLDTRFYVPYTSQYINVATPTVTIVRVLGLGGYQTSTIRLEVSQSNGDYRTSTVLKPSRKSPTLDLGGPTSASVDLK